MGCSPLVNFAVVGESLLKKFQSVQIGQQCIHVYVWGFKNHIELKSYLKLKYLRSDYLRTYLNFQVIVQISILLPENLTFERVTYLHSS